MPGSKMPGRFRIDFRTQCKQNGTSSTSRFLIKVNAGGRIYLNVNTLAQSWHFGGQSDNTHDWSGWHHVAWTYNSATNTTKLYFDGVEDYSSTSSCVG